MLDKEIWLWLSLHFGAGSSIYHKLYAHFGSVDAIYDCDDADVDCISWLASHHKRKLLDKNLDHAHEIMDWCDYNGVEIVTPSDSNYPYPLRALEKFPAVLYCLGKLPDFQKELCISVVGTRKLTMDGQRNAYNLGYGLAKAGAIVVSGMARGIDSVAQKGALFAGGSSVAVLGCGIDIIYPKENAALMYKLSVVGAVVTEYPPKTPPLGTNFPVRNRIISALGSATVVVEADMNSGSLITARYAKEQGKMVFAFPGPVGSFSSKGTNNLISEGAKVATEAIDVLEQFMDAFPNINLTASKQRPDLSNYKKVASNSFSEQSFYSRTKSTFDGNISHKNTNTEPKKLFDKAVLNEKELMVYDKLEFNKPASLDTLSDIDLDVSEVVSVMTMLEIKGAVESAPGGFYIKK